MEFDVILILDTIAALNLMIEGLIEILTCPLYHESQCVAAMRCFNDRIAVGLSWATYSVGRAT